MKKNYLTILVVAVAFLPLIYQFVVSSSPKDSQTLFTEHFEPQGLLNESQWRNERNAQAPPSDQTEATKEGKRLYQLAVTAYQAGDFEQAAQQFEAYRTMDIQHEQNYSLYLGIAYLATERFNDAQDILEEALNHVSPAKKGDAEWYLVLTLIRKNALNQAKQRLDGLVANVDHPRHKQAVQLQRQIQRHTS